ncbi:hypothetical protein Q4578_20375 [Shimia thalassica]|uniref:calcium-binding protein n=1 Tax=Shimia thalassica TaxID=1715693 RepID=UPI0026E1A8FB|nr:hypothetical protein [Shimia thalassica]MDO6523956.1 hypothetical protein [Shimia thalassica]
MSTTIFVNSPTQSVNAGAGDQIVVLNAISDIYPRTVSATLEGGNGTDTLDARNVFVGNSYMGVYDNTFVDRENGVENVFSIGDYDITGFEIIYGSATRSTHFLLQHLHHSVTLHGGSGDDKFFTTFAFSDTMYGYRGNDEFSVRPSDRAYGGDGDDIFELSGTHEDNRDAFVDGGSGTDTLDLSFGWNVDLDIGTASWLSTGGDRAYNFASIENVIVHAWRGYDTTVQGDSNNNHISVDPSWSDGSVGVTFNGLGGRDTLIGSEGQDTLLGGGGSDSISGEGGDDSILGDGGNDTLTGEAGNDTLDGGVGLDTLDFSDTVHGSVQVEFSAVGEGAATDDLGGIDVFTSIEAVIGSTGDDTIIGSAGDETLSGGDRNDRLEGGGGSDVLDGGAGQDTAVFGFEVPAGADVSVDASNFYISSGDDTVTVARNVEVFEFANVTLSNQEVLLLTAIAPSGEMLIEGNPLQGQTLTANTTDLADENGLGTFRYQWLRDGNEIEGASNQTYELVQDDVNSEISVRVTYIDGIGVEESVTSSASTPVSNVNDVAAGNVLISGSPFQGQTLNADLSGLFDEDGLGDFSYQWLRGGEGIAGATSETYVLGQEDVGEEISLRVSYVDGFGTTEGSTSSALLVENVNDPVEGELLLSGTALEGETLTADASGLSDPDGLGAFSYQWLRDGNVIAGETGDTYQLAQTDAGASVSVRVSFVDGEGASETVESDPVSDIQPLAVNLTGTEGNELLAGTTGDDTLNGGDGADTLVGGEGNDTLIGGTSEEDLRDVIYGGDGNDSIEGGYGNDELRGDAGNDTIAGGFGADTVIGGTGNDVLTGSAFGDQIFGGDGDDFINGGWGYDLVNGGAGADRFFHIGIADHGSDWIQDYDAAEGDILQFGITTATASQFQVNTAHTATAAGERSGDDNVEEAFVIYRPTGQIMWALVDGAGQSSINLQIGGDVFDLLA